MRRIPAGLVIAVAVVLAVFSGMAIATQNKDTVQVPGVSYPGAGGQAQPDRRQ
jgi:hypothetical protein